MQINGRHVDRPVKPDFTGSVSADGTIEVGDRSALDFWLRISLSPGEIAKLRSEKEPPRDPATLVEAAERIEEELARVQDRKSVIKPALVLDAVAGCEVPMYSVALNQAWEECERGNTLLVHGEGDGWNAWLSVAADIRLEITWRPDNYPALNVTLVKVSDEDLYQHLIKSFGTTWDVWKLNLGDHTTEELKQAWIEKELKE